MFCRGVAVVYVCAYMYTCVCGFYQVGPMTKFGQPPLLAGREVQRFGPTTYQSPVPRLSAQSLTPRERGGAVSVTSNLQGVTPRDRASVASFHSNTNRWVKIYRQFLRLVSAYTSTQLDKAFSLVDSFILTNQVLYYNCFLGKNCNIKSD